MASTLYQTIKRTAAAFIDDYQYNILSKDITILSALLTPDCLRFMGPQSFLDQVPRFKAGLNNKQYEDMVAARLALFTDWKVSIKHVIVDEHELKASVGSFWDVVDTKGGKWLFEFSYVLKMSEDGSKISRVEVFTDTELGAKFDAGMK